MSKRDPFREMFGDELADQVDELKRKPGGVEVLKPRPKPPAPEPKQEESERWWDR